MADFSAMGYLATKAIAEREDMPGDRVKQLSIVGAIIGLTPMWLVVAQTIARRERPLRTEEAGDTKDEHK
jgi:hypothetical protein